VQIQSSGEIVRLKFSELMQRCKVELARVRVRVRVRVKG